MLLEAIYHKSDSIYCFAVGERSVTLRLRAAAGEKMTAFVLYNDKYKFRLTQRRAPLQKIGSDGLFDWYSVTLELQDPRLVYIFELESEGQRLYYSEEGFSADYDYSNCHFTTFQLPYVNQADRHHPVSWMENAVFYQIFVDRFNIGNPDKDFSYVNLKWGELPTPSSFAGGDLAGITQKLPYIRSLGVTALYLTPIFRSTSNHKYDTIDYYEVDPQFGTKEDLIELADTAHSLGMKLVLDAVFNHCSLDFAQFRDVREKGRLSAYYDWFFIDGERPTTDPLNYESFAEVIYMPKLNTANPEVESYLIGAAQFWMRLCKIDGWRLDVSDEVSHDFWRKFRKAVKRENPDCVIIGENWHDSEPFLRGDQFDGVMNYGFTKASMNYFCAKTTDERGFSNELNALLMRCTDVANSQMLNLLDSHDTDRFLTLAGGKLSAARAAIALEFFLPGAACVYYGGEIDLPGGYDPDSRRTFDWSAPLGETAELIKRLAELKRGFAQSRCRIRHEDNRLIAERGSARLTLWRQDNEYIYEIFEGGSEAR
ncbi:MAG: glycoside hydrolase family 13 protein [Oscillospiraceae bacterium]|jgi:glycosidase|nr:glycoside hydrolase family 13 protein [Oscillospiraceae bacterium]